MIGVILKSKAFLEDLEELEELIATRKKSPSEKLGLNSLNAYFFGDFVNLVSQLL
ncbi:hypothetical protein [Enterococcus cecorum]|uniref:hypothetical protein n=1 Tax=Enterococcus cecorum TaxID=44008 RepID=UPI00234BD0BF|nr:hypothetical protein [Enterococcus cecorum]